MGAGPEFMISNDMSEGSKSENGADGHFGGAHADIDHGSGMDTGPVILAKSWVWYHMFG